MSRLLIGLSVSSGLEGVDVTAIRAAGVGLDLSPSVAATIRVAFPLSVRDHFRTATPGALLTVNADVTRNVADTAIHAIRHVHTKLGVSARDAFVAALLEPAHPSADLPLPWPEVADRIAEQTGITVVHGFRHRDRAAGGSGHPITAAADYLLYRSLNSARLLVHLGAVTAVLFVPAAAQISNVVGFEAGPGNQLLDSLVFHGTRGKESSDPGGKKAVQGKCLEPLLERWQEHPHLTRRPPKAVHPEAFGRSFLLAAFEAARQLGAGLPDLLCTATHLAAQTVGHAARTWLPTTFTSRQILATGGGVRNGFLWQLISQQFGTDGVVRSDEVGVPAQSRNAACAAVLGALTCDGVAGNLSMLTGATGGRLLGHLAPGDGRNWAKVASWIADQTGEYPRTNRVA
ncbi:MAG: anhydro-N-acetylmuramic acid kinase [Planctomycetes bacterium]|nr:anhydro-N-acetylmuramic acid kinase [Planctomycetota bacterium]